MDRRRVKVLYDEYVVAPGLERLALFEALRARFAKATPTVLYPGSSIHVTPSFCFEHVVYVDRSPLARDFFASKDGVMEVIGARKQFRGAPFVRFIDADFTAPLPVPEASFDLLLALYAGGIARACARYLKPGGLLLTNDHHDDAGEASSDPELRLEAAVDEGRGRIHFMDAAGFLVPIPAGRRPGPSAGRRYVRGADYYLFRRRASRGVRHQSPG